MGYYSNALVLASPPDTECLQRHFSPGSHLTVYKHLSADVWWVDARAAVVDNPAPFYNDLPLVLPEDRKDEPVEPCVQAFWDACNHLPGGARLYERMLLMHATALAATLRQPVFAYAADDEGLDFACLADPGGLLRFASAQLPGRVVYERGGPVTVRFRPDEHEGQPLAPSVRQRIARVPGVATEDAPEHEGGFYENVTALWPSGDPDALARLGTWDLYDNLETDFAVVFEADVAGHVSPSGPWWKFW